MLMFNYNAQSKTPAREKIMTMLHCNDRVTSKICLTGFEKWHVELCRLVGDMKTWHRHTTCAILLNNNLFYLLIFEKYYLGMHTNNAFKSYRKC